MPDTPNDWRIGRGFDRLANIYDRIVSLVFGQQIAQLQRLHLSSLPAVQRTLIVGGGSGLILQQLYALAKTQTAVYAELSPAMIQLTRKRLTPTQISNTIFLDARTEDLDEPFDRIVLPFVLDCYSACTLKASIPYYMTMLRSGGTITCIDFHLEAEDGKQQAWWKHVFISILYSFFRVFTSIPATRLAPMHRLFLESGCAVEQEHQAYDGWIRATTWSPTPSH